MDHSSDGCCYLGNSSGLSLLLTQLLLLLPVLHHHLLHLPVLNTFSISLTLDSQWLLFRISSCLLCHVQGCSPSSSSPLICPSSQFFCSSQCCAAAPSPGASASYTAATAPAAAAPPAGTAVWMIGAQTRRWCNGVMTNKLKSNLKGQFTPNNPSSYLKWFVSMYLFGWELCWWKRILGQ